MTHLRNRSRMLGIAALAASVALAGCVTGPRYGGYAGGGYDTAPAPAYRDTRCYDCGVVTRIETVGRAENVPNATGAVLGGIVGAAAGRGISRTTGGSKGNQNVSTVAGAVAGAMAGNAIQNNVQQRSAYYVYVRFDDGRTTVVQQNDLAGIREGSAVAVRENRAYLR